MDDRLINIKQEDNIVTILKIVAISIFGFSFYIRIGILGDNIGKVNFLFILCVLLMVLFCRKQINKMFFIGFILVNSYVFISSLFYEHDLTKSILTCIFFTLPTILLSLDLESNQIKSIFIFTLKLTNYLVYFIVLVGIVDYFCNMQIITYIASFLNSSLREYVITQRQVGYRLYSIMGHPLSNTEIFLIFYIMNYLGKRFYDLRINSIIFNIIFVVGLCLTVSKTGIILGIILVIVFNYKKKTNFLIAIIIFICIYFLGFFNNILSRFASGDLTTGRNFMIQYVSTFEYFPFKFFTGYGRGFIFYYNTIIPWASAAYEYPIRMFSLELGILSAILIYLLISIFPVYCLLKYKNNVILFAFLILFIDINTYNAIANSSDSMLIYTFITCLLINLSKSMFNLLKDEAI